MDLEQLWMLVDVALAGILGALLGYDRERAGKPAGLRTHILVAVATAVFVTVGLELIERATEPQNPDPIRMLEAIATGISFLGAGTIIFRRQKGVVEGLTTAASLLLVGAVSLAVVIDLKLVAVAVTVLAFITLSLLGMVERRLAGRHRREREPQGDVDEPEPQPGPQKPPRT